LQKGRLKREGIDVRAVEDGGDKVYWLPMDGKEYVPFYAIHLESLRGGKLRL